MLRAARPLGSGRVIVVFGCGGDRDRAKRPAMGRTATENADLTVLTSDNPRSEDPAAILAADRARRSRGRGRLRRGARPPARDPARPRGSARRGDVVVIAGKGHETEQAIAGTTVPFDDRVVAREELVALGERA